MQNFPQAGDKVTVPGISFPLTVESAVEATRLASLQGEHPDFGMPIVLPQVCFDLLTQTGAAQVGPAPALGLGDVVCFKSGGPKLTVTALESSVEDAAAGHVDLICWEQGWKKPTMLLNISPDCLVKVPA